MDTKRMLVGVVLVELAAGGAAWTQMTPAGGSDENRIVASTEKKMQAGTMRSSQLIGVHIYDKSGEHIGQVTDLLLDKKRDSIGLARMDFHGSDMLKDKSILVPIAMLRYSPSESRIYVSIDGAVLREAPNVSTGQWEYEATGAYFTKLDDYLKDKASSLPGEAKSELKVFVDQAGEARPAGAQMGAPEGVGESQKLTSFIGRKVVSANGDDLGKINEVVIDTSNGKVLYAVLSYGGMVGMRDKLYAVPISAFQFQMGSDKLQLNATKEQLKGMPGFDKDNWPATADPSWAKTS